MQEAKINLGKVVRIARKRKRITQDYLAEKVGVQPRTILEIENGRGNPLSLIHISEPTRH